MQIFGRVIRYGDPGAADIVIFDECNQQWVRRALNRSYSVAVYKMRPEEIWIGRGITFQFLRFLGLIKVREATKHPRGILRGILSQLLCIYSQSVIVTMKPKAVVTFIDNSGRFGWLSRSCRRFPFIAIQNGSRLSYAAQKTSGYYLQHLFCFGDHEVKLFPSLGYYVETFHPVGSLVASLQFDHRRSSGNERYDLLVVSTWRGNIGFQQDVIDSMRSMKIMDQLLARYIREKVIKAAVILRAERDSKDWTMPEIGSNEEQYYQGIYGDCIAIIETDSSKRNVFPSMQDSRVIVSCLSTALVEAFGIGKKILYCNFTGTNRYHQDLDPSIVTSDCASETFFARLDELIKMPEAEYNLRYRSLQQYYMKNPASEPSYRAIADSIDRIIAAQAGG